MFICWCFSPKDAFGELTCASTLSRTNQGESPCTERKNLLSSAWNAASIGRWWNGGEKEKRIGIAELCNGRNNVEATFYSSTMYGGCVKMFLFHFAVWKQLRSWLSSTDAINMWPCLVVFFFSLPPPKRSQHGYIQRSNELLFSTRTFIARQSVWWRAVMKDSTFSVGMSLRNILAAFLLDISSSFEIVVHDFEHS